MKKFFTLIACALVAGSAFAQDYKDLGNVITNGGIAYDKAIKDGDFSLYPAEKLTSFKSRDRVTNAETGEVGDVWGTPRVVIDPEDAKAVENGSITVRQANYYLAVQTRVLEEGASGDPWDSRFYITLPIDLAEGDKVTFSMKVRAKEAGTISAQGHTTNDGNGFKVYRMQNNFCNNVAVSADEWTTYSVDEFEWPAADEGVNTFAFDLGAGGNEFYFDDIVCKVQQKYTKEIVWKLVYENDGTTNAGLSVKKFKNYTDEAEAKDGAIAVKALEPGVDYAQWYYMEDNDGNPIDVVLANEWDTQFLIPLTQGLAQGKKFKLTFKYKADTAVSVGTQAHSVAPEAGKVESKLGYNGQEPYDGTYITYQFIGNFNFDTEWKTYEETITKISAGSEEKPVGSVCFNLNPKVNNEFISNTFYFDDIKVWLDEDDITTAINTFKAEKAAKTIYNVAGQQIKSLQKGLNIVNGEKVYVK